MEDRGVPYVQRGIPVEATAYEPIHTGHARGTGTRGLHGESGRTTDAIGAQKGATHRQVRGLENCNILFHFYSYQSKRYFRIHGHLFQIYQCL